MEHWSLPAELARHQLSPTAASCLVQGPEASRTVVGALSSNLQGCSGGNPQGRERSRPGSGMPVEATGGPFRQLAADKPSWRAMVDAGAAEGCVGTALCALA